MCHEVIYSDFLEFWIDGKDVIWMLGRSSTTSRGKSLTKEEQNPLRSLLLCHLVYLLLLRPSLQQLKPIQPTGKVSLCSDTHNSHFKWSWILRPNRHFGTQMTFCQRNYVLSTKYGFWNRNQTT